jgi:toxin ParE1/3/4
MKRKLIQKRQAERDLIRLAKFIRRDNPDAARRLLLAFDETVKDIANLSEMGNIWETDIARFAGLRWWAIQGFPNHLIFYRLFDDQIVILRVLHGARDLQDLFG